MRALPLLLCLAAAWAGEALPAPEETAALLLSPDADLRRRGLETLAQEPGAAYERAVLRTLALHAADREEWIRELHAHEPEGALERLRIARMLAALRPQPRSVSVDVVVVAASDALVHEVVGEDGATVVSREGWARWRAAVERSGAPLVFAGGAVGDEGAEAEAESRRSVAYISDFEIETTPKGSVADPVVDVLELDARASWRPVVSGDFVTLDLAVRILDAPRPLPVEEREVGKAKVRVQVPDTERARAKTVLALPLPGHAAFPMTGEKGRKFLVFCRARRP